MKNAMNIDRYIAMAEENFSGANGYQDPNLANLDLSFEGEFGADGDYYDADGENPLNNGLENFGYSVEVRCDCHYVPSDRLNIINSRM